jgi:hypothetical protein
MNRFAAKAVVELQRGGYGCIASARMRDYFDQWHEVRRIERVSDQDTLGMLAFVDELGTWNTRRGRGYHDILPRFFVDLSEQLRLEVRPFRCVLIEN